MSIPSPAGGRRSGLLQQSKLVLDFAQALCRLVRGSGTPGRDRLCIDGQCGKDLTGAIESVGQHFGAGAVAERVLESVDRLLLLERGRKILEGPAREVGDDPRIAEAYLGATAA